MRRFAQVAFLVVGGACVAGATQLANPGTRWAALALIGGAIGGGVALADTLRKRGPDLTLPTGTELNYQLTRELAIQ